ncbi:hypothetical protein EDC30_101293 [Paucimonas lemoignei]|uniref:Uncharacterized protein n=1 Tax=Paucimonas lemoignei TaxID=29443 RepID=A0A4R3I0U9_PAULE|nr:hypothetical protein EDC30_101293 [Paucimonas lemoignei]
MYAALTSSIRSMPCRRNWDSNSSSVRYARRMLRRMSLPFRTTCKGLHA